MKLNYKGLLGSSGAQGRIRCLSARLRSPTDFIDYHTTTTTQTLSRPVPEGGPVGLGLGMRASCFVFRVSRFGSNGHNPRWPALIGRRVHHHPDSPDNLCVHLRSRQEIGFRTTAVLRLEILRFVPPTRTGRIQNLSNWPTGRVLCRAAHAYAYTSTTKTHSLRRPIGTFPPSPQ